MLIAIVCCCCYTNTWKFKAADFNLLLTMPVGGGGGVLCFVGFLKTLSRFSISHDLDY